MFNNLGIFSRRRGPVRRAIVRPRPVFQVEQIGNDIFYNSSGVIGPPGPPGPPGPQGPAGTLGLVPVTQVTTTPFVASTSTDYMLAVDVAAAASIILPVSPTGTSFIVKDIDGDAAINPITITASTTIDGAAAATINSNYGSLTFVFNGTEWNIV